MPMTMDGNRKAAEVAEASGDFSGGSTAPVMTDNSLHPPAEAGAGMNREQVFTGIALSAGVAVGRPCFYRAPVIGTDTKPGSSPDEAGRVRKALFELTQYCSRLAHQADNRLSQSAGDIFRAHSMLASDPYLIEALESKLAAGQTSAEAAVTETFDHFVSELQAAASDNLRERASDIAELKHSLLMCLGRKRGSTGRLDSTYRQSGDYPNKRDHILIATQFVPGAAINASQHTRGFVVEQGGPSSHAAILARMMELPAVSGIPDITAKLSKESQILVDGDTGRVYVNPSRQTLARYYAQQVRAQRSRKARVAVPPVKGFRVLADLDRIDDIPQVLSAQAEGIGLYRSESEVLLRQRVLTEDEQMERYQQLVDAVTGPVCVRLLDLGADKTADWLGLPTEDNPALGCRGARLLLAEPELLRTQARALARASCKRELSVLYPMVHSVNQFLQLREIFDAAIGSIPGTRLTHGVMFEVPSACLEARELFAHADFGRIGTNDLTQYLFAADRMNGTLKRDELFEQPALWKLIETVVRAAAATGKPLSICGELVAEPKYIGQLLRAGISEVSVCPHLIAKVRRAAARLLESPEGICCSENGQYSFLAV